MSILLIETWNWGTCYDKFSHIRVSRNNGTDIAKRHRTREIGGYRERSDGKTARLEVKEILFLSTWFASSLG